MSNREYLEILSIDDLNTITYLLRKKEKVLAIE